MSRLELEDLIRLRDPVWQSVVQLKGLDRRRKQYKRIGWVYAVRNPCLVDPVFKVGQTGVSPYDRIASLSSSTSIYHPFELVYLVHVSDRNHAEEFVHSTLHKYRVNPNREFFDAPITRIIKALDQAADMWAIPVDPSPRSGMIPPLLGKRIIRCPKCNHDSRVPQVLVKIEVLCSKCGAKHMLPPLLHGAR